MARKSSFDYHLIVIGSGATGSAAALAVARAGKKVALVEGGDFGGESPNYGDIPTKAVLHAANLYADAKAGSKFGLRSSMLGYNYPTLQTWKQKAVKRSTAANSRDYYRRVGIDTFDGIAHFLTPHEITINRKHLTAANFIVATGTQFAQPDVFGIDGINYQTPRTILDSKRIPRSLFIVGASSEALEYAQIFATLGTKVYVSERAARILPDYDEEVGQTLEQHFASTLGVTFLTETQLTGVEQKGLGVRVSFTRGETTKSVQVDQILFMERSSVTDLGLENAHVKYTPAGIDVNDNLQTSAKHIYAGGGAVNSTASTQTAIAHGRTIAHNLLSKAIPAPDPQTMPRIIYTSPTVATVGLSGDDCLRRDLRVTTAVVPLTQVARANTTDTHLGFVKLITDKKGALLGATIVAPSAPEMINELTLAINQGLSARDLAALPHGFFSWSEAIRVAAGKLAA